MFGIKRSTKVLTLVAAMALVATALIAPGAGAAKKALKVNIAAPMGIKGGGKITGKASGSIGNLSLKKVPVTGTAVPPKMTAVFNLAGGSVIAKTKDGHVKKGVLYGTFKDPVEQKELYEMYRGAFAANLGISSGSVAYDLSK